MHEIVQKLDSVKNKISKLITEKQLKTNPKIIVVSKTFSLDKIVPIIESGHLHFGENKLQEAEDKWLELKEKNTNINLHMIGKLQSNKAKKAVQIFDYIHSLDNAKLASKIFKYQNELNKKVKLFIQVNIGDEKQKSGILVNDLNNFYHYCTKELSLNIIGLMCIPPVGPESHIYFKKLKSVCDKLNLKDLSMGMSSDFEHAVINGSTYLRLGTVILGQRKSTH
jgi:PLP dependent protein